MIKIKLFFILLIFPVFGFVSCDSSDSNLTDENEKKDDDEIVDGFTSGKGSWEVVTNSPSPDDFLIADMLANDTDLYVFLKSIGRSHFLGEFLWKYNYQTKEWKKIRDLDGVDEIRTDANLFWYNNAVNQMSGSNGVNLRSDWFEFNPITGESKKVVYDHNLYFTRSESAFWFLNNKIYTALGDNSRNNELYIFPSYDIVNQIQAFEKEVPSFNLNPKPVASFIWQNRLCMILKGLDGNNPQISMLSYDLTSKTWTKENIKLVNSNRLDFTAFIKNDKLYIGAGKIEDGYLKDFYEYNFDDLENPTRINDLPEIIPLPISTTIGNRVFLARRFNSTQLNISPNNEIYEFLID